MAYDEHLADRVGDVLLARPGVAEREMFGGVAWMVGGNMACGVMGDDLVVRLAPDEVEKAIEEEGAAPFGREGIKPMKGFVVVDAESVAGDVGLAGWVDRGMAWAASLPAK